MTAITEAEAYEAMPEHHKRPGDHDPKPLRYQFEAEHAGQFTWLYQESGPAVWRVRIGRVGA